LSIFVQSKKYILFLLTYANICQFSFNQKKYFLFLLTYDNICWYFNVNIKTRKSKLFPSYLLTSAKILQIVHFKTSYYSTYSYLSFSQLIPIALTVQTISILRSELWLTSLWKTVRIIHTQHSFLQKKMLIVLFHLGKKNFKYRYTYLYTLLILRKKLI